MEQGSTIAHSGHRKGSLLELNYERQQRSYDMFAFDLGRWLNMLASKRQKKN